MYDDADGYDPVKKKYYSRSCFRFEQLGERGPYLPPNQSALDYAEQMRKEEQHA